MNDYQFNTQLMRTLYLHCGFKKLQEFKEVVPFSPTLWYNAIHKEDIHLPSLLSLCNQFHINPCAFFIREGEVIPSIHTDNTYKVVWEVEHYVVLPDGSARKIMHLLNPRYAFTTKQRMLRPGSSSTMKASDIIYILNTYNLRPDQFFIPKE